MVFYHVAYVDADFTRRADMAVVDEMRHFQMFLQDEYENTDKMPELYELVQYAGNIIPRLYVIC